ncbi:hypothetical protein AKJ60_00315 [candidate division MSBL1 archaeon SCGC-AAA385M11]|nr:hypothetical protein AKJ60_00315 [candidate division MSBL1 archaeon SCGC-AAA385M11]
MLILCHKKTLTQDIGDRQLFLSVDGRYAGHVLIGDQLKPDAVKAMDRLRSNGVKTLIMLTGDNEGAAAGVAKTLHLDQFHAGLLPEDKVRIFEQIRENTPKEGKVAFFCGGRH